jgi:hypothetical protein
MSAATDFLSELNVAKNFEDLRVLGYSEYLSLPNLSPEERFEVQEGLTFSSDRVAKLVSVMQSLSVLIEDGYPLREQQTAEEAVIRLLKSKLDAMQIAYNEFDASTRAEIIFTTV